MTTWWESLTPSERNQHIRKKIQEKKEQKRQDASVNERDATIAAILYLQEHGYTIHKKELKLEPDAVV
jgi:hypothetical protein